jgi:hypothetical protein
MRTVLLALCIVAAGAPAAAATRNYSVTSFDRIRLDGPFKVKLTTGVAPFAIASGSAAAIDSVSLDVQGRTLVIRGNASSWGGYPGKGNGPVEISVGTHELSAAWVNGAGGLAIDRVKGLSFDANLQGSGALVISSAEVDRLTVGLSGAGTATISGKALQMTAIVRGTSTLDASSFAVKDAKVGAEGPATVLVNAGNSAQVTATGLSTVTVAGNPSCTVKISGSATVSGCD